MDFSKQELETMLTMIDYRLDNQTSELTDDEITELQVLAVKIEKALGKTA
jgi:hypothetical protein